MPDSIEIKYVLDSDEDPYVRLKDLQRLFKNREIFLKSFGRNVTAKHLMDIFNEVQSLVDDSMARWEEEGGDALKDIPLDDNLYEDKQAEVETEVKEL